MTVMLAPLLLVLQFVRLALGTTPTYCLCTQLFVYDPNGDCSKSAQYGVENACFTCPIVNATGTFYYCGSMVYLGYGACNTVGALAARNSACDSIGGNTGLTSYTCTTSTGTDKSQLSACGAPTQAPSLSLSAPTAQPTNSGGSLSLSPVVYCVVFVVFALLSI
jgi:hypothetical protein